MCTSPVLIHKRSSVRSDRLTCLSIMSEAAPKLYRKYKTLRASSDDFFYNNLVVPCGKCAECLKRRQQDLACRCANEAAKRGSMHFFTLTYNESTLPFAVKLEQIDKSTGEIFCNVPVSIVERGSDLDSFVRDRISKLDKSKCRYVYSDVVDLGGYLYRRCCTPSLNRRDVQLWIKACRVQYEREFHLPLKKFSYVCCGEMGSNTHRPHYHLAFFGISDQIAYWMAARWNRQFGFSYVQRVNAVNDDGSSGFSKVARYIGKYMTKGDFDCESVKCGYAVKNRLMASIGVGSLPETVISYYRCEDLFGKYDINTGIKSDGSSLSSADYDLLAQEVYKRCKFRVGDSEFLLPQYFKNLIWYVKNADGSMVSSFVRREVQKRLRIDPFENYLGKLKQSGSYSEAEILSLLSEFSTCQNISAEIRQRNGVRALSDFYKHSKF